MQALARMQKDREIPADLTRLHVENRNRKLHLSGYIPVQKLDQERPQGMFELGCQHRCAIHLSPLYMAPDPAAPDSRSFFDLS